MGFFGIGKREAEEHAKALEDLNDKIRFLDQENLVLRSKNIYLQDKLNEIDEEKEKNKADLEKLQNKRNELKNEIEFLNRKIDSSNIEKGDIFYLGEGTYYGGSSIPTGIYNLRMVSGRTMIETKKPRTFFSITSPNCKHYESDSTEYFGLEIKEDTVLKINDKCKIQFYLVLKKEFSDEVEKRIENEYGKAKNKAEKELENLKHEIEQKKKDIEFLNEDIQKENTENGKYVLHAGKYRGGKDIPTGVYNLTLLDGVGSVDIRKPEDLFFTMSKNPEDKIKFRYIEKYNNFEISKNSVFEIDDSAIILFSYVREYSYEKEIQDMRSEYESELQEEYKKIRSLMEEEIKDVKDELKILNDETIEKYYVFSDYDDITSQDCKNELAVLKSDEKRLRESEMDIDVLKDDFSTKNKDRIIRQILRNFNSEFENITRSINIKNIDIIRDKMQKSFETINKLYSQDGIALSNELFKLKLQQATYMYTYEKKLQQEKEIQKAIKEQMMDEAKAEREILEQKKKIEKDLQQHNSEVKRLMKYIQKSQTDIEKQLYIDKIHELEEKIKSLESDKEKVIEREENAKAGFVYIISNVGSFGEGVFKIGMTRRLEPMDRINELSSASVPFEFDVHAMIFSSNAPELENMLHRHFADRAVNKVNPRKEFYAVDIDEIEKVVKENYNDTVQFTKIPNAYEYRQSIGVKENSLKN